MKLFSKIMLITGSAMCVGGVLLATGAAASVGFDFSKFDTSEKSVEQVYTPKEEVNHIAISAEDQRIRIEVSDDDQVHLTYYEDKYDQYSISEQNGALKLTHERDWNWGHYVQFNMFFGWSHWEEDMVLKLPKNFTGSLDISTFNSSIQMNGVQGLNEAVFSSKNGSIIMEESAARHITAKTTNALVRAEGVTGSLHLQTTNSSIQVMESQGDTLEAITTNGNVKVRDSVYTGTGSVETTNSSIVLENIQASEMKAKTKSGGITANNVMAGSQDYQTTNASVKAIDCEAGTLFSAETTNANITVDGILSDVYMLKTTNSSITGTVRGEQNQYNIISQTTNANSNLSNQIVEGSDKQLNVRTTNGTIRMDFAQ